MKMTRLTAVTFLLVVIGDAAAVAVAVAAIISTVTFAFSLRACTMSYWFQNWTK